MPIPDVLLFETIMATAKKLVDLQEGRALYGHRWAVQLLQQAITGSRLRHAILITGPRHVGKTTFARAFASTLLCTESDVAACGRCRSCRLTASGNHPDFRWLQPRDKHGEIDRENGLLRSDSATELVRAVSTKPFESAHKFFLLQDAHLANESFLNKILKTLEEPPAHAILCLTATDRSRLLPTIVSRCQIFQLRPLDTATVSTALQELTDAADDEVVLLARLSAGRLGWALQEYADGQQLKKRHEELEQLCALIEAGPYRPPLFCGEIGLCSK